MSEVILKVKKRGTGKTEAKNLRKKGLIPGIFYTKDIAPIPIVAEPKPLRPIVHTSETKIVRLQIEGEEKEYQCILKDVQIDPLKDTISHFDLFGIHEGSRLSVEVPIVLKGQPVGVREGGTLQQSLSKVRVKCLPDRIPTHFEIDISNLKIGKAIHISDIQSEGIEFELSPETVIVACIAPRVSKS
ncbi:50S ribosomal protein L25 [Bacteroidetes/Chlorobi group bacterium Naka2016]|jgi:large subunit ribosomal protein L25|nr:MAG: 50S ribosomal protein L25 [Bacteroidetes/Chlorobi group bacterium Naka2016]